MEVFIVSILSGLSILSGQKGKLCIPGHLKVPSILLRLDPFVFRAAFGGVNGGVGLFPPLFVSLSHMRITFLIWWMLSHSKLS